MDDAASIEPQTTTPLSQAELDALTPPADLWLH